MINKLSSLLIVFFFLLTSCGTNQNSVSKVELETDNGKIFFDQSITNFQQTMVRYDSIYKKFIYSPRGKDDLNGKSPVSGFLIIDMNGINFPDASFLLDISLDEIPESLGEIQVKSVRKKKSSINNLRAYTITHTLLDEMNKVIYVTLAVLSKDNISIKFMGYDYDGGIYSDKFLKTIESLEI